MAKLSEEQEFALLPETVPDVPVWATSAQNLAATPGAVPARAAPLLPTDDNVIDATDIRLNAGRGGLGLGETVATPAPGTDVDTRGNPIITGLADIKRREMSTQERADQAYSEATSSYRQRAQEFINKEEHAIQDIPSWNEEAMRAKFRTQPLQAFGSIGSIFAVIASAFTKRPMINALQGSAAAMEAIKAGDKDAFDHAFEAFKTNTELAIKRQQMEHQAFTDTSALFDRDMEAWHEAQKENALRFGNERALFLLNNGLDKEYIDGMVNAAKAGDTLAEINQNTTKRHFQETMLKQVWDNIDANAKEQGLDPKDPKVLANKLVAMTRILGDQGKQTPIQSAWAQALMQHPEWTSDQALEYFTKLQEVARKENDTMQMATQIAIANGRSVANDADIEEANRRLSVAKGTAAAARVSEVQAGQDRRAELAKTPDMMFLQNYAREHPGATIEDAYGALQEEKRKSKTGPGGAGSLSAVHAQTINEVKDDLRKEHPDWTPGQIDLEAEKRERQAQAAPITGNARERLESHIEQFDNSIDRIDKVVSVLNKYAGAAGIAGRATRLGERVRDIFGSKDTDRVQMMRDIELLQLEAPALLLDRATGRPISAEAGRINSIIAGLNIGDTTANTLRSMQEIKKLYQKMQADAKARIGEEGTTRAPAATDDTTAAKPKWHDALPQ